MNAKRGRPPGHVRLTDDDGRFEVALWLAMTEAGIDPYPSAYLSTFLISDAPITAESVEGVLLELSATCATTAAGHADRVRRKSPEAIERADDADRDWLARSCHPCF